MKNNSGKFPYADVADRIQGRIEKGVFRISEKLPLLQVFCRETGSGMTTVFQACVELEKRGGGESCHRSGCFIKARLERLRHPPEMKHPEMVPAKISLDGLIHQLTEALEDPRMLKLGSVAVAPDHLPFKRRHKRLKSVFQKQIPDVIAR